jgi:hypothetical protein
MRTARAEVFRVNGIFSLSAETQVKGNVATQPKKTGTRRYRETQLRKATCPERSWVGAVLIAECSAFRVTRVLDQARGARDRSLTRPGKSARPLSAWRWQADTEGAASDTAVPTDPEAAESDSEVSGAGTSLLPPGSYLGREPAISDSIRGRQWGSPWKPRPLALPGCQAGLAWPQLPAAPCHWPVIHQLPNSSAFPDARRAGPASKAGAAAPGRAGGPHRGSPPGGQRGPAGSWGPGISRRSDSSLRVARNLATAP